VSCGPCRPAHVSVFCYAYCTLVERNKMYAYVCITKLRCCENTFFTVGLVENSYTNCSENS